MIVTVFGGSSPGTPALLSFLVRQRSTNKMYFRLVGRSSAHLEAVGRAARILTRESSIRVETFLADADPKLFLSGAAVVLVQARIGGLRGRLFDESFPLRYGLCGDEGLGPGGLSAAWRSWPRLQELLEATHRHAPGAFVVLLTSPVGILTRLACFKFPALRIAGICELPWTTLQQVCGALDVPCHSVHYSYVGINHIGWFHRISAGERELVKEYAAWRGSCASFPSGKLIRACGAVPLKYLRLHYEPEQMLAEQRIAQPRSAVLAKIADRAMETFLRGSRKDILAILPLRPTPWYEHAVGPLLLGFSGEEATIPFFLSVPDSAGDVWEVPHEFHCGELKPVGSAVRVPAGITETLLDFIEYERLAAEAVLDADEQKIGHAVANHPWMRGGRWPAGEIAYEITRSS